MTPTMEKEIKRPSGNTSAELDGYPGLAEVKSRATRMALSYDECRAMIAQKAEKIKSREYRVEVRRVRVMPGWRDVLLFIFFADGSAIQVRLDLDRDRVLWVKNYLE